MQNIDREGCRQPPPRSVNGKHALGRRFWKDTTRCWRTRRRLLRRSTALPINPTPANSHQWAFRDCWQPRLSGSHNMSHCFEAHDGM